jgi:NAD(P)-dependent dehydrogenase (short-subunit alcohol dehydrogenase family)
LTDLTGQVAIVTGASSGLGRRFAEVLAGAGASVALLGRRADRLEDVARTIAAGGGRCAAIQVDVSDPSSLEGAMDSAEDRLGNATILVNNAAMHGMVSALDTPIEFVDQLMATNVRAPWLLSCELARRLIERNAPGRIVNISSIASFKYSSAAPLYAVTKAAVNRMTELLAVEWATFGINVNAIAPGAFRSEMMDKVIAQRGDTAGSYPRQRMGDPSHLDSTLLYLVAPESEFITGTIIKADDGQHPR